MRGLASIRSCSASGACSTGFLCRPRRSSRAASDLDRRQVELVRALERCEGDREILDCEPGRVEGGDLLRRATPFRVAEQVTGQPGKYLPVKEAIRSVEELVEGKHDDLPEQAFLNVGNADSARAKAKQLEDQ